MEALVYVNHGRVIVDCPTLCGNAYVIPMGSSTLACEGTGGCGANFALVIPSNLSDILAELNKRPALANRNWFPEAHPIAIKGSLEMNQSPTDLALEFEMMSTLDTLGIELGM